MSDSLGGISKYGMNYTPISSYNQLLQNNLGSANFDEANNSLNEFQNILDNQMMADKTQNVGNEQFNLGAAIDANASAISLNTNPIQSENQQIQPVQSGSAVADTANKFSKAFENGLTSLNEKQLTAQNAVETLASGGNISVHEVMIASQKASLNMQMAMQLRNKMLAAYNELYQMRF